MFEVLFLVERGHPWDMVLNLPVPAFDTLYLACFRMEAVDQLSRMNDMATAHHGLVDAFKKRVASVEKLMRDDGDGKGRTDQDEFVNKFGK